MDETHTPFNEPGTPQRWMRPRRVRVTHVDLQATIDLDGRSVEGVVEHHCVGADASADALELDAHELEIGTITCDGAPIAHSATPGGVRIALPRPGLPARVRLEFRCREPHKGLYFIAPDPARGRVRMCWTQGAMEDHSWWFPCLDTPNNLCTYRVAIRHRAGLIARSGGVQLSSIASPDGWVTTVFAQDRPHVLYLLTVVVGEFAEIEQLGARVPIAHLVPRGRELDALAMFRATPEAIAILEGLIGVPFPWQRYGHAVVHGFMWGGMENTTLTTISDRVLMDAGVQEREDVDCDSLVVHELVHQWFGDLLTMKSWSDIWLNESFATWLEARGAARYAARCALGEPAGGSGSERERDEYALRIWRDRQAYFEEDRGRYRRALVTNRFEDAYELFDRVAYEKGCLVLHHLCAILGEERMRSALALYAGRHAHDLIETADFRQAVEDATGEGLDWFVEQWLYREGHPRLRVRWRHDAARAQLVIEIEQTQAASGGAHGEAERVWRLPCRIGWSGPEGSGDRDVIIAHAREVMLLACPFAPRWVAVDPEGSLPAEWDEQDAAAQLCARLQDARAHPHARARAAVGLGLKPPSPSTLVALRAAAGATDAPELVRQTALEALGEMRTASARDQLRALLAEADAAMPPRLRRTLAHALGCMRGLVGNEALALELVARADAESSQWCAGEFLAARAALEIHGATPILRARMGRPSWGDRLRAACVRGLGLSVEAPAVDEIAALLASPDEPDAVLSAACEAAGALGARMPLARTRLRLALERKLDHHALSVRASAARALANIGDGAAALALGSRERRELFGNVARVLREAQAKLGRAVAQDRSVGDLARRVEEGERERARLLARLETLEKRLEAPSNS